MEEYKNIDLKIDLMLLNNKNINDFIDKYKDDLQYLFQRLKILIYLDDFMYIDNIVRDKLILLGNVLTKKELDFDEKNLQNDIIELNAKTTKKTARENTAILAYYKDLNEYMTKNDINLERLDDICKTIIMMNNIYINKRNNDCKTNKVILFLNDIKYNIEFCNIKNNMHRLMNCKKTYQKMKK